MTLNELAETLPNGFHDALLHRLEWDVVGRVVVLELSVWTGDLHADLERERERHDRQRLVLEGVRFFQVEPPDARYPYAAERPVRIDLCEPDRAHPLMRAQPAGVFGARFFVQEWNASIHLAADAADLVPLAGGGA